MVTLKRKVVVGHNVLPGCAHAACGEPVFISQRAALSVSSNLSTLIYSSHPPDPSHRARLWQPGRHQDEIKAVHCLARCTNLSVSRHASPVSVALQPESGGVFLPTQVSQAGHRPIRLVTKRWTCLTRRMSPRTRHSITRSAPRPFKGMVKLEVTRSAA
jgi:hypothetical protein